MVGQPGFFDLDERYRALAETGDPLIRLAELIQFEVSGPHPADHLGHRRARLRLLQRKAICSSVNLLFFTASLLPSGSHKAGKLALKPEEKKTGGRHRTRGARACG